MNCNVIMHISFQYIPPTSRPHIIELPEREEEEEEEPAHTCSLCGAEFSRQPAFHAHLVECGGLNQLVPKKKSKKTAR